MSIIKEQEHKARISAYSRELNTQEREIHSLKTERFVLGIMVILLTFGMLFEMELAIECKTGKSVLSYLSHDKIHFTL